MKTHKITSTRHITDEQINDLMSSALAGMFYWSDWVDAPVSNDAKFKSDVLTHGGTLEIHDAEADKIHTLKLKDFLRGLELKPNLNLDNYDMSDAEQVVQLALFGKVVYS